MDRKARDQFKSEGIWLLAALLLTALLGLHTLLWPMHRDQGIFATIGDRWVHGGLPYRDAWDIKPPGIFAIYALAEIVFGRSMAAFRIADLLGTLLAAAGLYLLNRRNGLPFRAFLTAALFGIAYFLGFYYWSTAQAESFAAPLTVLYVYALLRARDGGGIRWWLLAGLCLGTLTTIKTSLLLFFPIALVALWPRLMRKGVTQSRRPIRIAAFGLAALLPILLFVLYFAYHHALKELVELMAAQKEYTRGHYDQFWYLGKKRTWEFITNPALTLSCLAAAYAIFSARYRRSADFAVYAAWLAIACSMVVIQKRFFAYHFLPILPPLVLLASGPLEEAWLSIRNRPSGAPRAVMAAVLLALFVFPIARSGGSLRDAFAAATGRTSRMEYWRSLGGIDEYSFVECVEVADYVRAHTRPDEPLLVYAFEPAVYFLADRTSPTRHLSSAPIWGEKQIPAALRYRWLAEQHHDVAARPPEYMPIIGCPHCMEMQTTHGWQQPRVDLAGIEYDLVKMCGKFAIYRRAESRAGINRLAVNRR